MSSKISKEAYIRAFRETWEEHVRTEEKRTVVRDLYPKRRKWTDFMKLPGGILNQVMDRLGGTLSFRNEWYTVDALYVEYINDQDFPSAVQAVVEHENGADVENEMWKLLYWRAPLKVIIFYDWSEGQKRDYPKRQHWLSKKLVLLSKMKECVDTFHAEASDTQYLFIIGTADANSVPSWSWTEPGSEDLHSLC